MFSKDVIEPCFGVTYADTNNRSSMNDTFTNFNKSKKDLY